jgi:glycosyltransferase involved in cell wall biosynthesis
METRSLEAGIERRRIFTVLQGTDIEHFRPPEPDSRHAIRLREQIPEDAKVVIFCGAITERKGVDLLLRAWPSVLAAESKALLLLVGPNGGQSDDPGDHFLNAMRRLAALPANGTSVRFLGYREDVRALMQSADAFVLPSRMEGTPNALLEAMATGLPIVIAELPGISGVFVRAGVDAVVVPQNDAVGISESLKKLLGDTRMAKHFGEKARERAVLEFSHLNIVKRFADAFRGAT